MIEPANPRLLELLEDKREELRQLRLTLRACPCADCLVCEEKLRVDERLLVDCIARLEVIA